MVGRRLCDGLLPDGTLDERFLVRKCRSRQDLLQALAEAIPDVILMDAAAAEHEDRLLPETHRRLLRLPVVVLADDPEVEIVVQCVKDGAYDVVSLRKAPAQLADTLRRATAEHNLLIEIDQLQEAYKRWGKFGGRLVGVSSAMQQIYSTIAKVAKTDASVFLSGESGTGKELVAHTLHELSPRKDVGRIICVNCATIPKDLLESELFGHEKGSFTGADSRRIGRCEQAHMGTLFLDEICEMDVALQSKLLRFLEERTFTRVGGSELIPVDTRVIAATNRVPMKEVERGQLREDLYYRLNVVPIHIPPLRDRPEDIPVLAQHFLSAYGEKHDKYFWDFSPEAMRIMLCHKWPGNVRELRNTIERIVVLATGDTITPDLMPEHIREATAGAQAPKLAIDKALETIKESFKGPTPAGAGSGEVLPLDEVEKRAIIEAVRRFDGNVSLAARKLGLSRATMYRKLEKYGIK